MSEYEKFEKKISGKGNPLGLVFLEQLITKAKKCICKIYYQGFGTGFFCKIPIDQSSERFVHVFFTNNHVLDFNFLNTENYINIEYLLESKKINLSSGNRFKYTNELLDYTIIEIFPSDNIKDFFDIDEGIIKKNENTFYQGQDICIIQHPEGKEISFSQGEIINIIGFKIKHSASTKEGSSGSPIILVDKMTVVGMHSSSITNKNLNGGIFMKNIIEDLYEKNLIYKIKEYKLNYSTNQKGSFDLNDNTEINKDNLKMFFTGCPVSGCPNNRKLNGFMGVELLK